MREATDMELLSFLVGHIDKPCVEPVTGYSIRDFYLNEAEKAVRKMSDPYAMDMLFDKIRQYRPSFKI